MSIDLYEYMVGKVLELVTGPKSKQSNKLKFRCPFCGDSKKHKNKMRGYLYRGKDLPSFHCFNCKANFGPYRFLCALENKSIKEVKKDIAELYKKQFKGKGLIKLLNDSLDEVESQQQNESNHQPKRMELGKDWIPLESNTVASTLIRNRRVLEAPYAPVNWRLYYDKELNRIVIPWVRNGEMVYYQHRTIHKSDLKYVFPKDLKKDVFGLDDIDRDFPYLFITEGVFDSIWVKNCVAIGGIYPTEYQMEILEPYTFDMKLVFLPDNPWVDKASAENLIRVADREPSALVYRWLPNNSYKDINLEVVKRNAPKMYTDEELLKSRITTATKMKIELKFRK